MTTLFGGVPLRPRNGVELRVLVIARISTVHQDVRSLDDQAALCEKYVRDHYPAPVQFTTIQGRGSGEVLDRAGFLRAVEEVESARYDLVITEELARVCRRAQGTIFCETCEDARTRLVAINDSIDTARGDWRLHALFATAKHEMSNRDTAARIRRSLRHRFTQGGVIQYVVFGHVKPTGAKSDADLRKDPAAEPVYDEKFRRLEDGASFAEVADWLNAAGIPPGPYARVERWLGRMVARLVFNPILKGVRVRNAMMSMRHNKTGRRKSVKAPPEERLERHCPHLAFIDPARYDRVIEQLKRRNVHYARAGRCAWSMSRQPGSIRPALG
ncbi:MAG TPA: recombinase family protein [Fimbriiglobus sp.]|nr:recombinase family protein [Fimbriiglobus sp.]